MTLLDDLVCDSTVSWRLEQLLAAGFDEQDAHLLAADAAIDLHAAVDLLNAGCPPELAIRIL